MRSVHQIAHRLAQLCREKKFKEAYNELYDDEDTSVFYAYNNILTKGFITLLERERIVENATIHKIKVSGPLFAGNYFAINIQMDFTMKNKARNDTEEICVYHVKAGKITRLPHFMD